MGRTACTEPQCLYKGALTPNVEFQGKPHHVGGQVILCGRADLKLIVAFANLQEHLKSCVVPTHSCLLLAKETVTFAIKTMNYSGVFFGKRDE
jgi:hypothetical protein